MRKIIFLLLVIFNFSIAKEVTIIGDSLSVGATKYLKSFIPDAYIDAKVGRKFQELGNIIPQLEKDGKLKDIVVLELGTNGDFEIEEALNYVDYLLNKGKKVILVNVKVPRWWQDIVNRKLYIINKLRPQTLLLDWYYISNTVCQMQNINCFREDGYHLTDEGSYIFSYYIYSAISVIRNGEN
ncbi:hypothetical protein SAMN06264868_102159 [Venenivibrio stagnispumantis]|uniref:Uncharacterized protein n=1 Tax=Venenivibrio stagnispumantis TaxID=407998 RepID=A0AA45WJR8_9AQUI|nr:hypothetical protein SAMN06264868_102159 [Venenivibrio stagnispumantis]